MASCILSTDERISLADKLNGDLASGHLDIYTAAYATKLVSIPLAATAGTVSNGVLTLTTTNMNNNAIAAGTAAAARYYRSDDATIVASVDVGAAGSGASIIIENTSIASGQNVSVTSATLTVPAGT